MCNRFVDNRVVDRLSHFGGFFRAPEHSIACKHCKAGWNTPRLSLFRRTLCHVHTCSELTGHGKYPDFSARAELWIVVKRNNFRGSRNARMLLRKLDFPHARHMYLGCRRIRCRCYSRRRSRQRRWHAPLHANVRCSRRLQVPPRNHLNRVARRLLTLGLFSGSGLRTRLPVQRRRSWQSPAPYLASKI